MVKIRLTFPSETHLGRLPLHDIRVVILVGSPQVLMALKVKGLTVQGHTLHPLVEGRSPHVLLELLLNGVQQTAEEPGLL